MVANSDFNFTTNEIVTLELPFSEHMEELRQRFFHIFWIILLALWTKIQGWDFCLYSFIFFQPPHKGKNKGKKRAK